MTPRRVVTYRTRKKRKKKKKKYLFYSLHKKKISQTNSDKIYWNMVKKTKDFGQK